MEKGATHGRGTTKKGAVIRLAIAAILFLGWISYLAYLAISTHEMAVLYRPQLLASKLDVVAQVKELDGKPDPNVMIRQVCWPRNEETKKHEGKILSVQDLPEHKEENWNGAGLYILPLIKDGDVYRVAPVPRSPGFGSPGPPRIYPLNPDTRKQLEDIRKIEIPPLTP